MCRALSLLAEELDRARLQILQQSSCNTHTKYPCNGPTHQVYFIAYVFCVEKMTSPVLSNSHQLRAG